MTTRRMRIEIDEAELGALMATGCWGSPSEAVAAGLKLVVASAAAKRRVRRASRKSRKALR
jgi:hypothetical protein